MCEFSIPFDGGPAPILDKARSAITGVGGVFNGDEQSGSFSIHSPVGKIEGSYKVDGQTFHMLVSEKPFFITCQQIESQLKKSLGTI